MKATIIRAKHLLAILLMLVCGVSEAMADASDAYDEVTLPVTNFTTANQRFMGTTSFDDNTVIKALIDLTQCKDDKQEYILSLGQDIAGWGGTPGKTIHLFYKGKHKSLEMDLVDNVLSNLGVNGTKAVKNWVRKTIILDSEVLSVKLTTGGLYINDELVTDVNDENNAHTFILNDCLAAVGFFNDITTMQVGARQGDVGSNAKYSITVDGSEPKLIKSDALPIMNYSPTGAKYGVSYEGFNKYSKLTAVIDLTTCEKKTGDQNIFTIGEDLDWGSKLTNGNLHFYYDSSAKTLKMTYVNKSYGGGVGYGSQKSIGASIELGSTEKLTIELSNSTLTLKKDNETEGTQYNNLLEYMANFWNLTTVMVGSAEGNTNATYDYVNIEDADVPASIFPETLPWENLTGDGKNIFFATVPTIDYDKQSLYAMLNINACASNENVLSVSSDLDDANAKCRLNIYTNSKKFTIDLWKDGTKIVNATTDEVASKSSVEMRLTKAGLFVDGKRIVAISEALLNNNCLDLLKENVEVGSVTGTHSKATYTLVKIDDTVVTEETLSGLDAFTDYTPGGTKLFHTDNVAIDFDTQNLEATIDLSTCGNGTLDQNILSVGTQIMNWGASGQYNLHLYYTPSTKKLVADVTNGGATTGFTASQSVTITGTTLKVRLTKEGLYINDNNLGDLTAKLTAAGGLLSQTNMQIGAVQGRLSKAVYTSVSLVSNAAVGEFGRLPWTEAQASKNGFMTTEDIDFDRQYIEATFDVTNCESYTDVETAVEPYNETLLSVGSGIDKWNGTGISNLHVYYCKRYHRLVFDITDTDALGAKGKKEAYYYLPESTKTFTLKIAAGGIYVDGAQNNKVTRENVTHYKWNSETQKNDVVTENQSSEDLSKISASLYRVTRLSSVQVGSKQGDHRSTALYKSVKIVDSPANEIEETITIPQEGYTPTVASDKFKAYLNDIDFAKKTVRLTIDLTNCTSGKNENIFSIGNGILGWGGSGIYNIHAYYNSTGIRNSAGKLTEDGKTLQINFLDNGESETANRHRWAFTPTSNTLVVEFSDQGLTINGVEQDEWFTGDKLYNLLSRGNMSMLGSLEGSTHVNNATYNIEVIDNDDYRNNFSKLWISSPLKVADHKEAAHATLIPYASTSAMTADTKFYAEPWQQPVGAMVENLNGTWKFYYVKGTEDGPDDSNFYTTDTDDSSWANITVPMSWEMAGYGTPVYANIGYPFSYEPPFARTSASGTNESDNNATGFYRRTFTVPSDWNGKRVFVHFDGVYSAAVVWVNGKYVGYSQGSNTDAEFDITDAIDTSLKKQQLSVRVYRWCDGSYFEGQDMWHLSGIHRDVYLKAVPKVFVSDHVITTDGLAANATSASKLNVKLTVDNRAGVSAQKTFNVALKNAKGETVATGSASYTGTATETVNVELSNLTGLTAWTAETPYLYTVEVSQKDNDAEEMAFSTKYGFRNITIDGGVLKVNGKRIYIKGVNSHDTNPTTGKAVSMDDMLKDIQMMKRANINTFRGSHYPRQPKMYAMFDAMGMYVIPSADIESHYNWQYDKDNLLTSNANWLTAMKDRTERMVRRDINHVSVIVWSLGNESGKGTNFKETYNLCKELDASRPVHYEGDDSSSDFLSFMYPKLGTVQGWASKTTTKPYIMCEYAHAMGQAVGNLKEYWDAVEASDQIAGGCIWDWADQALYKIGADKKVNGFHNWTAGYDYNRVAGNQFQGNFLDNGLVTPDRHWTAKLAEVKKVYQNASFESFDGTTLTIKNKSTFANLEDYTLVYRILRNGRIVEEKQVAMPSVEPGNEATINVSYTTSTADNAEYAVNFELQQKTANNYAEAGYVVADEQFVINPNGVTDAKSSVIGEEGNLPTLADYTSDSNAGTLSVVGGTISGTDADGKAFSMTFSNGRMTTWTYGEKNIVAAGPDFNSQRNIDNDVYSSVSLGESTSSVSVTKALSLGSDGNATMSVNGSATGCTYTIDYTFYPDATVDMNVKFTPSAELRRIGLGMQFVEGFENVEYYGRGPWSNYVDRKTASYLGRYYTTVDNMVEEMIHPQTYGDHQDLRELTLTNYTDGTALRIETAGRVAFSLSHYDESKWCSMKTLWNDATHWYDLSRNGNIFAHFDYWQRGLGNNSCGAEQSLEKYQCPVSGIYSYTLRMKPQTAE